ncbi:MAG: hypothetical protein NTV21_03750, partial [Planctomycetota bacterium]|nr:hypothetical protein [Planctomycetota bacterium]
MKWNELRATLAALALLAPAALAQDARAVDTDGDGLADRIDPEPLLSNRRERFVYRLESPTLSWELDQEQVTLVEESSEEIESQIESARQAAVEVLAESTGEATLRTVERVQPEAGWMQLSINPLAMLGGLVSGVGPLDALASGVRRGGDEARRDNASETHESSIQRRVQREESRSREQLAERRTRLLRIQRFTRILRNPRLQISLHLRNGGTTPLVIERPEVP